MTDPTPTRDEAPDVLAKQVTAAASDMCEIARIAGEWRNGPKQSLTAIREIRAVLASAPAPASGGVDAAFRAGLDAAAEYLLACDDYGDRHKADNIREIVPPASLSPAATPGSEAGGEPAFAMNGVAIYGDGFDHTTGGFAYLLVGGKRVEKADVLKALAKPASSPAGGEPTGNSGLLLGEASADDAPCYLSSEHADSWAKGFNAAVRALSQSTSAGRVGE